MSEVRINRQLLTEVLADLNVLHSWSTCEGRGMPGCCSIAARGGRVQMLLDRSKYSEKPARHGEMRVNGKGQAVIWHRELGWQPAGSMEGQG